MGVQMGYPGTDERKITCCINTAEVVIIWDQAFNIDNLDSYLPPQVFGAS
ncbi:hypothetical protein [Neomoorella mulderi]|nr:hypothetical protein [Moorella mulderi]